MIAIGRITKSVGLKGEMKVEILSDLPDRFFGLDSVFVGSSEDDVTAHALAGVRKNQQSVIVKLGQIDTRTMADKACGKYLFIPDNQARRPSENAYFVHEVVGLTVVTEEGVVVGVVDDVIHLPAGDIWIVKAGPKEILIPGVKEFIRSVNLSERKVIIHAIEGLLE